MHENQAGTLDIISYRTTRNDPIYKYPIEGAITGTSISHIALRIVINNRELFDKYINGSPTIPYDDNLQDPKTGEKLYEIYFSFWPKEHHIGLQTMDSALYNYQHDCDEAAMLIPMSYNPRFTNYLRPNKENVSPNIPILNYLFVHTITLAPSIILHQTRFKAILTNALQDHNYAEIDAIVTDISATAELYSKLYDEWFDCCVAEKSASTSLFSSKAKLKSLAEKTAIANDKLKYCSIRLKAEIKYVLFKSKYISDATFLNTVEQFISFGMPEADCISLPLVLESQTDKNLGLDADTLLKLVKDIADNPHKYQYKLFTNNCATVLLKMLNQSSHLCPNKKLQQAFMPPWYVKYLSFPVSPAMVMKLAAKAAQLKDVIQVTSILTKGNDNDGYDSDDSLEIMQQRNKLSFNLDKQNRTLRFSTGSDVDERSINSPKLRLGAS